MPPLQTRTAIGRTGRRPDFTGSVLDPRPTSTSGEGVAIGSVDAPDPRLTRDLWASRLWREWIRRAARVAGLLAADGLAAMASVVMADALVPRFEAAAHLFPAALLLTLLGQAVVGTYGSGALRRSFGRMVQGALLTAGCYFWISNAYAELSVPATWTVAFALVLVGAVRVGRMLAELAVRGLHHCGVSRRRALIVGVGADAWEIVEHFRREHERSITILGHLAPRHQVDPTALGEVQELGRLIGELDVEHVIVSARVTPEEYRLVAREAILRGATISVIAGVLPESQGFVTTSREVVGWPALQLRVSSRQAIQVGLKRALDIVGATFALVLFSPILLAVSVAVKLDSPGPVLFRQRRPGLGGRPFHMLKFRSMRADAEQVLRADPELYRRFVANGCKLSPADDPRISRLGLLLRQSSLDELPQLFNVLRGDMSLVGPRPVVGPELADFGEHAELVLCVKPGMTGHWQVNGRSTVSIPERARLDAEYITEWSIALDIKILLRTIPAVIRRTGAH